MKTGSRRLETSFKAILAILETSFKAILATEAHVTDTNHLVILSINHRHRTEISFPSLIWTSLIHQQYNLLSSSSSMARSKSPLCSGGRGLEVEVENDPCWTTLSSTLIILVIIYLCCFVTPKFRDLLKSVDQNSEPYQIIVTPDFSSVVINAILDLLYYGETSNLKCSQEREIWSAFFNLQLFQVGEYTL